MTNRRVRANSLPINSSISLEENENIPEINNLKLFDLDDETSVEADDEATPTISTDSKRPSLISKQEIEQARRLSQKMNSTDRINRIYSNNNNSNKSIFMVNSTSTINTTAIPSSSPNLINSVYSIGEAVWSFIRGPVETDSNDEVDDNLRRSKSNFFSIKSKSQSSISIKSNPKHQTESDSEDCHSETSSAAPDFDNIDDLSSQSSNSQNIKASEKRSNPEPGRGKIIFKDFEEFGSNCTLIGRDYPEEEHVLTKKDISTIQSQIPARWKIYTEWILLYSTRGHGFSLTTLYNQLKYFKGPLIIAVKDEFGAIFGAFVNQSFQPTQGHYGNGESFLWRKEPEAEAGDTFVMYPSTGKNNYFIITESDYLAIGCGDGKFGLWLEKSLFKGISDPVPTFDNEQLSTNQKFECIAVEIWGLDMNE